MMSFFVHTSQVEKSFGPEHCVIFLYISSFAKKGEKEGDCFQCLAHSPAEDSQHQVEHEEGADNDQGHEVDDVVSAASGVVHLKWGHEWMC